MILTFQNYGRRSQYLGYHPALRLCLSQEPHPQYTGDVMFDVPARLLSQDFPRLYFSVKEAHVAKIKAAYFAFIRQKRYRTAR